jgi:hypothetical protein
MPNHRKPRRNCRNCGKEVSRPVKVYCNGTCQHTYQYNRFITRWQQREVPGWVGKTFLINQQVRRYLFEKYDNKCCRCGWDKIHPITGRVPLEVHHIDGDASNSYEENLELICPNCHALTETFRALNSNSKRQRGSAATAPVL